MVGKLEARVRWCVKVKKVAVTRDWSAMFLVTFVKVLPIENTLCKVLVLSFDWFVWGKVERDGVVREMFQVLKYELTDV